MLTAPGVFRLRPRLATSARELGGASNDGRRRIHHVERRPQHGDVYGERAGEMRGEPVGRHPRGVPRVIRVLDEPGLDHPPADGALRRSEAEERRQARRERARDPPLGGEVRQGQDEVPAQRAAPLPVSPLHPVYELEVVHGHPRVRLLVLWGLLVLGELRVPVLGGERRFLDELPVGHGQAAASEPRDAAQDDHAVHPRAPAREPPPERSFRGGSSVHQRMRRDWRDGRRRRGGGERARRAAVASAADDGAAVDAFAVDAAYARHAACPAPAIGSTRRGIIVDATFGGIRTSAMTFLAPEARAATLHARAFRARGMSRCRLRELRRLPMRRRGARARRAPSSSAQPSSDVVVVERFIFHSSLTVSARQAVSGRVRWQLERT